MKNYLKSLNRRLLFKAIIISTLAIASFSTFPVVSNLFADDTVAANHSDKKQEKTEEPEEGGNAYLAEATRFNFFGEPTIPLNTFLSLLKLIIIRN